MRQKVSKLSKHSKRGFAFFPRRSAHALVAPLFALVVAGIVACGSFDLGDEKPTEVAVDANAPNWNADIQRLMAVKCMNCHADPKPKHAPKGTPAIALSTESTFKQKAMLSRVWERVYRSPTRPMPPEYGTPMTSLELLALKKYLSDNGVDTTVAAATPAPSTPSGGTATGELSSMYKDKCVSCHGAAGEGVEGLGKKLAATSLSEAAFLKKVQDGVPGTSMIDFDESEAPAATVKADYAVLKTLK